MYKGKLKHIHNFLAHTLRYGTFLIKTAMDSYKLTSINFTFFKKASQNIFDILITIMYIDLNKLNLGYFINAGLS
jgi:hypothetical protein